MPLFPWVSVHSLKVQNNIFKNEMLFNKKIYKNKIMQNVLEFSTHYLTWIFLTLLSIFLCFFNKTYLFLKRLKNCNSQ